MALGATITLKDSAAVDVNFDFLSSSVNPKTGEITTVYVDRASLATAPRNLTIKQAIRGKGLARVRATLVQLTKDIVNSTTGFQSRITENHSWVFPMNGDATQTDLNNLLAIDADMLLSVGTATIDTTRVGYLLQGQS